METKPDSIEETKVDLTKAKPKASKGKVSFVVSYPNRSLVIVPADYPIQAAALLKPGELHPKPSFYEWVDFYMVPVEKEIPAGDYLVAVVDMGSVTMFGEWRALKVEQGKTTSFIYAL